MRLQKASQCWLRQSHQFILWQWFLPRTAHQKRKANKPTKPALLPRPAHCDTDLDNLRFLCDGVQRKERREKKKKVAGSKLAGQCFSKFSMPANPRDSRLTGTVTEGAEGPVISASLLRAWVTATLLSFRLHLQV